MLGTKRNKKNNNAEGTAISERETKALIKEIESEDPNRLIEDAGPLGKAFIRSVDAAVNLQTGTIRTYVNWLRRQNPDATPDEIQELMTKQFRTTVATTGAGAGLAAAIPGVGFVTGAAAIAGESVLFLDLAAFYTVASAYLRGTDISDPERRRAVVLTTLTGAKGVAIVDTILGSDSDKPLSKNAEQVLRANAEGSQQHADPVCAAFYAPQAASRLDWQTVAAGPWRACRQGCEPQACERRGGQRRRRTRGHPCSFCGTAAGEGGRCRSEDEHGSPQLCCVDSQSV